MGKLTGRIVFEPTGEFRKARFGEWCYAFDRKHRLNMVVEPGEETATERFILRVVENTLREVPEPRKMTFGEACKLAVDRPGKWVASRDQGGYCLQYWNNKIRFGTKGGDGVIVPSSLCHINGDDIAAEWTEIVDESEAISPEPDYLIFEKVPGDCVAGEPCMTNDGCVHRQLLIPSPKGWTRLRIVRDFNKSEVAK